MGRWINFSSSKMVHPPTRRAVQYLRYETFLGNEKLPVFCGLFLGPCDYYLWVVMGEVQCMLSEFTCRGRGDEGEEGIWRAASAMFRYELQNLLINNLSVRRLACVGVEGGNFQPLTLQFV
jgi:hypothetical protein